MPEALLRGVIDQPAHLLLVQTGGATGGGGRSEGSRQGVRADVRRSLETAHAHGHREACSDVVAECDGAQQIAAHRY